MDKYNNSNNINFNIDINNQNQNHSQSQSQIVDNFTEPINKEKSEYNYLNYKDYNNNNDNDILLSNCLSQILKNPEQAADLFVSNLIIHENFCNDPWSIINNSNILLRYKEKLYPVKVGIPILLSKLMYNTELNENTKKDLFLNKSFFGKTSSLEKELEKINLKESDIESIRIKLKKEKEIEIEKEKVINNKDKDKDFAIIRKSTLNKIKSQNPTSAQIKLLNLKPGKNNIKFVCRSRLSGEQILESEIYLWEKNEKIIISDVDGTITKSDVLGQLMPILGNDWAQPGVSKLYNSIEKNGYKILYLTARALCQSTQTKNYLNKLNQDELNLPKGPLIMSPDGLFQSFKREVIDKTPQVNFFNFFLIFNLIDSKNCFTIFY
jgi:phosphatidate phosphatase LPIN